MTERPESKKELIDLLPSDILSEMDMDTEGSQGYEDNEESIVDVKIIYIS